MEHVPESDLRAMIREALAARGCSDDAGSAVPPASPSHQRLSMVAGGGDDQGACLIEPEVRCTHCGYCQSFGN
jgi:hypothetical protein